MEVRVVVEMRVPEEQGAAQAMQMAAGLSPSGFQPDTSYTPVPIRAPSAQAASLNAAGEEVYIVRGTIEEADIRELEAQPNVLKVSRDTPIAPFAGNNFVQMVSAEAFEECPISPCDCEPGTAKGTIQDVAEKLGVDQIWETGHRGEGIVIGIVDGGITAEGRPVDEDEQDMDRVERVIGGWPEEDWGTTGAAWGWHGNMTATDALGMAPEASIYDIRISDAPGTEGTISDALAGFQWAIDQHRQDGTPHVLSNSWGIFQEDWDEEYATDPDHFFTRQVVDALDEGIFVLFAAGNCGERCPDSRCGSDTGPGESIWGANGHPRVMTVGAVNIDEELIGYSSQGPAALDSQKPDFCSISHFEGYFDSDTGTSAACPIAAGVVALLAQANSSLTQNQAKNMLMATAEDIGPAGWDQHSGAGIIQAKDAFDAPPDINSILAAEGSVTFLRAHDVGTGWGPPDDHLDVEVVFKLDTHSDKAFGFQLREGANEGARRRMLDLLRDAFNRDHRVRADYVRTGVRNGRAFRVMKIT